MVAQKVKLSTIAETLGLSTATVSLALRDSPLVAAVTRDKIKEQARALGYIYNRRAASLRTSRSGIIGVVVHDIMNPFYGEILKAIEAELDRDKQTFILSNHYDSVEKQRDFIETLLQLGGDGVIMSPAIGTPPQDIQLAEDNGMPAILIARSIEGLDVPIFRGDDAYGISLATNHLIGLGHRCIAMVGERTRPRPAATATRATSTRCARRISRSTRTCASRGRAPSRAVSRPRCISFRCRRSPPRSSAGTISSPSA